MFVHGVICFSDVLLGSGNTAVAQPSIPASAIHAQEFVPQGASTSFNVVYGPGEGVGKISCVF